MALLLRPFRLTPQRVHTSPVPLSGPSRLQEYVEHRHATADFTEADDDDEESHDEGQPTYGRDEIHGGLPHSEDMLPRLTAAQLDSLPAYGITHAIRMVVESRTETTLTWDQLRSPQVVQFLVKPMQQQIRGQHFSRATLYALMANCLQFIKEGQLNPATAGTSSTRAKLCELLAIKLLKEYSTRELIDALLYDFYPLQGIPGGSLTPAMSGDRAKFDASRTSALEIAISASAKKFLSHPLVVQQLKAVWNGAITYTAFADHLHRTSATMLSPLDSPREARQSHQRTPLLRIPPLKESSNKVTGPGSRRRLAILYDPRQASLLKLSRLRVPMYRQMFSTCSLAIFIGLYLAVLIQRSKRITTLELVFWFWSAGFMLDELVGFTEHGFSFSIISFWNIFDLGVLLLLMVYYCMRIYGVFRVNPNAWNDIAYEVLSVNAILLLPRIFNVLGHYQYFSQLLIAFRLMAVDLAAIIILILISCSGFLVFFAFSGHDRDGIEISYKIFQILMGYTPAAWETWPSYDWLGRSLMVAFLLLCHFAVAAILVTVLAKSFMTISSNASEEHHFLFAINTISEVKSEALFSYIPPGNIFAWALLPLRYCIPLRQFVWLNRFIIKSTHFPLLFCIFAYERYNLAPFIFEPTDLVENRGTSYRRNLFLADPASYQKVRALDEVFRRAPDYGSLRMQRRNDRRKTQNAVRTWVDQHRGEYNNSPHEHSTAESRPAQNLRRRSSMHTRDKTSVRPFQHISDVRSIASDPADMASNMPASIQGHEGSYKDGIARFDYAFMGRKDHTDGEGDDERATHEEEDDDRETSNSRNYHKNLLGGSDTEDGDGYFTTSRAARFGNLPSTSQEELSIPARRRTPASPQTPGRRGPMHGRTTSSTTILYAPQPTRQSTPPVSPSLIATRASHLPSRRDTPIDASTTRRGGGSSSGPGARSPRHPIPLSRTARPGRASLLSPLDILPQGSGSGGSLRRRSPQQASTAELEAAVANDALLDKMRTLEASLGEVMREMRVQRGSAAASAAGTPSDDEDGLPWKLDSGSGYAAAGLSSRKGSGSMRRARTGAGRRSLNKRESGAGSISPGVEDSISTAVKGKGKEVMRDEDDLDSDNMQDREPQVSLLKKGSSL